MLPLLLLLVVATASGQDADTTTCAKKCQLDFPYAYGQTKTLGPLVFNVTSRGDDNNRWFDPNDPKDHPSCGGRFHSMWWYGPEPRIQTTTYYGSGFINHFQIFSNVSGEEQMALVYVNNKLIDIVKDPTRGREQREEMDYSHYNHLMHQNYCIWDCLKLKNKKYAALNLTTSCLPAADSGLPIIFHGYYAQGERPTYNRISAVGPSCGYWTLSIRTTFDSYIKVVRQKYDAALAGESRVQPFTKEDFELKAIP